MYTFRMAVCDLKKQAILGAVSSSADFVRRIRQADMEDQTLQSDALYFGTRESLFSLLQKWGGKEPLMILFAEVSCSEALKQTMPENPLLSWACSPLDSRTLSDRLMEGYFEFHRWWESLQDAVYRRCGMQQFLKKIAGQVRRPVFWLNSGYRLLASDVNYSFEDHYILELLLERTFSEDSIQFLSEHRQLLTLDTQNNAASYEIFLENQHYAVLCELRNRHIFYGYLLLMADTAQEDFLIQDYARCISTLILRYVALDRTAPQENTEGFSDFVQDLLEHRITDAAQIRVRATQLNLAHMSRYYCVLVSLGNAAEKKYEAVDRSLQQIFSGSKSAMYKNHLLLMVFVPENRRLQCNEAELEKLLTANDGRACLGAGTQHLRSYATVYQQTLAALRLSAQLMPGKRIVHWEDMQIYEMIELCHKQGKNFHRNNLMYLCSPRYVTLMQYDRKNDDNLCDILKAYLDNDGNTAQTARALYLHRNTLINKLDKIESILETSLNSSSLRVNLVLSSMVADYARLCLHTDILQLKFDEDADADDAPSQNEP